MQSIQFLFSVSRFCENTVKTVLFHRLGCTFFGGHVSHSPLKFLSPLTHPFPSPPNNSPLLHHPWFSDMIIDVSFCLFLQAMWSAQPILTTLLLGLPSILMTFVCYSLCTAEPAEEGEMDTEDEGEEGMEELEEELYDEGGSNEEEHLKADWGCPTVMTLSRSYRMTVITPLRSSRSNRNVYWMLLLVFDY